VPFISAEGERDGRTVEGNDRRQWSAMMVVEAAVSRGDCLGSGAPAISEAEGEGHRHAAHAHPRRQWRCWPVGPGRKTTEQGGLAGLAKGRGPVAVWWR
jgi:hypothetical protein